MSDGPQPQATLETIAAGLDGYEAGVARISAKLDEISREIAGTRKMVREMRLDLQRTTARVRDDLLVKRRPANYVDLPPEAQSEIERQLGILVDEASEPIDESPPIPFDRDDLRQAESPLPAQRARELRRLYRLWSLLVEAVRKGVSRKRKLPG